MSRVRSACFQAMVAVWLGSGLGALSSARAADPTLPFTKVAVPSATCAAVSDEHHLLVVGRTGDPQEHLRVYTLLPEKGLLKPGSPQKIALPLAAGLEKQPVTPLSVVFHPKLPLLYVWLDTSAPAAKSPLEKLVNDKYDHLAIFKIVNGQLQLVGTYGHGEDFAVGRTLGTIALDPQGVRLFMPNLRSPQTGFIEIGYFNLDKEGLPIATPVMQPGVLDEFGLEKFQLQHRPTRVSLQFDANSPFPPFSSGIYAPNSDVAIFGHYGGPSFWDTTNRRAEIGWYFYRPFTNTCRVGGHPKFRQIYMCSGELNNVAVAMMTHADGFLTLLPRPGPVITGEVHLHSNPVVMPGKKHRLAIGGVNTVYVLPLDVLGEFDGLPERITVVAPMVKAITYSDKHERLYVAVEKL